MRAKVHLCGKFFDLKCPLNKPQHYTRVKEGFEMLQSTGESVYKAVIECITSKATVTYSTHDKYVCVLQLYCTGP